MVALHTSCGSRNGYVYNFLDNFRHALGYTGAMVRLRAQFFGRWLGFWSSSAYPRMDISGWCAHGPWAARLDSMACFFRVLQFFLYSMMASLNRFSVRR